MVTKAQADSFLKGAASPHLPQEAVGKSNRVIAEMLKGQLKKAGLELVTPNPFPAIKGMIWSVKSSKYPDKTIGLVFSARARGGRGINKDKNLSLSFHILNNDGTWFEPEKMNHLNSIAAITYEGIGNIYKERVA